MAKYIVLALTNMTAWKKLQRNLKIFKTLRQQITKSMEIVQFFIKAAYIDKTYLGKLINEPRRWALKTNC